MTLPVKSTDHLHNPTAQLVTENKRSVWLGFSVDTITVPDVLLNLGVTRLFKAQYKPKGPGMQPLTTSNNWDGQKISSVASQRTPRANGKVETYMYTLTQQTGNTGSLLRENSSGLPSSCEEADEGRLGTRS